MAAVVRIKENGGHFSLFKTPIHTPIRNAVLSSGTLHRLSCSSSRNNHYDLTNTINTHYSQKSSETVSTPIRLRTDRCHTPSSNQRRRALSHVNHNGVQAVDCSSNNDDDDPSTSVMCHDLSGKQEEPSIVKAPESAMRCFNLDDDLPHEGHDASRYSDTFDDLIQADERIERLMTQPTNGVNMFAFPGAIENTIRCQSPTYGQINISTLLDILH